MINAVKVDLRRSTDRQKTYLMSISIAKRFAAAMVKMRDEGDRKRVVQGCDLLEEWGQDMEG